MTTTAPTPDKPGHWVVSKFGPPSVLQWQTWDQLPEPSANEVRVKILVTGISGADNIQRAGGYPDERVQKPGFTQGYDFTGHVDAVGASVKDFAKGDLVASMCMIGAYATHIVLPAADLIKLRPDDDPIKVGALPLNYMTAFGMLCRAGVTLSPGSSILIGSVSGGVGTAMAQLVHAFDMKLTMFGTCSEGKFDFVRSLGVTPIDRKAKDVPQIVRKLNGGKGVSVAYDAVGSEQSLNDSLASLEDQQNGRVIVIGMMSQIASDGSGMNRTFDAWGYVEKHPNMEFWVVTHHYYYSNKQQFIKDFLDCVQKIRDGKLDPIVGKYFPLADAVPVNEMLVSGAGVQGKLLFIVDKDLAKGKF